MKAGNLDRRISILRAGAATDDGYTMVPGALGLLATRWAAWKPVTRREQYEDAANIAKAEGTFWLRSDSTTRQIVETDKLVHDGRTYEILGLSEIGRREGIELLVVGDDQGEEIDLSGLSPIPDARVSYTGWAAYVHTGAAQALTANIEVALVNNAGTVIDPQIPPDTGALYDGTVITGREGDSIITTVELTFTPTDGTASNLTVAIDIGGAVGKIYHEEYGILNGAGVAHRISYRAPAYTLDTWEANGGTVKVCSDGPGSITAVRYVIHRLHKAR